MEKKAKPMEGGSGAMLKSVLRRGGEQTWDRAQMRSERGEDRRAKEEDILSRVHWREEEAGRRSRKKKLSWKNEGARESGTKRGGGKEIGGGGKKREKVIRFGFFHRKKS